MTYAIAKVYAADRLTGFDDRGAGFYLVPHMDHADASSVPTTADRRERAGIIGPFDTEEQARRYMEGDESALEEFGQGDDEGEKNDPEALADAWRRGEHDDVIDAIGNASDNLAAAALALDIYHELREGGERQAFWSRVSLS